MSSRRCLRGIATAIGLLVGVPAGSAAAQPINCAGLDSVEPDLTMPTVTGCFDVWVQGPTDSARIVGFARSEGYKPPISLWSLTLITPGGESSLSLQFGGTRPPMGPHQIVDLRGTPDNDLPPNRFAAAGVVDPARPVPDGFHAVSGDVIILTSQPDLVVGTFTYVGRKEETGERVTVTGAFRAVNKEN
ncbi:MAG: hypothetical protein OEU54_06760 [Gemmatimonadota bacterium]|nr:hypothetical protein [Gemmatimonadota bacterium]